MMTVPSGGGRVGSGGPKAPVPPTEPKTTSQQTTRKPKAAKQPTDTRVGQDSFNLSKPGKLSQPNQDLRSQAVKSGFDRHLRKEARLSDLLRAAKNNPQLIQRFTKEVGERALHLGKRFMNQLAEVDKLLSQLASGKVPESALDQVRAQIYARRDRLEALRNRMRQDERRLQALRKTKAALDQPKLVSEIEAVMARLKKVNTRWEKVFLGLSLGNYIYSQESSLPEHLSRVIRAPVTVGRDGAAIGQLVADIHPGRLLSDMAARELDPTVASKSEVSSDVVRELRQGKYGDTLRAFARLFDGYYEVDDSGDWES